MNRLILCLVIFSAIFPLTVASQVPESLQVDLFSLYENASDPEGMFYSPGIITGAQRKVDELTVERRLQSAIQSKDYATIANLNTSLAWLEMEQGNSDAALSHFDKAMEAQEYLNNSDANGVLLIQKGFIYYRKLEYEAALKAFFSALEKLNGQNNTAIAVTNALIAHTCLMQKDFDKASAWFGKAHENFKSIRNKKGENRTRVQLAEIAIRKQDTGTASGLLDESLMYYKSTGDLDGQALVLRDLGIISYKSGNYEDAVSKFKQSHDLSQQLSVAKLLKNTLLKQFTVKSLMGDHEASNKVNIEYVQLRDSIDRVERSRILNSQMIHHDLLEKEAIDEMLRREGSIAYHKLTTEELQKNRNLLEAEIERLEKEKIIEDLNVAKRISDQANIEREDRIQQLTKEKAMQDLALSNKELEVSRGNALRNTLIITTIFIIVISVLLYNRYLNKVKSHQKLDKAYRELSETHSQLVATQEQLVYAQKMASLGQLTAGIAHEIQNPLNFVNNFSEVSMELIDELKQPEADKQGILDSLLGNLQKINAHGRRADKIVKGMLLHSRTGDAEKVPADINKMIDELLELSYHGNRSRDNSFSAEITRNFNFDIPKVNVIPQDISRVFINLFNNAFYAVGERAKKAEPGYQPMVEVNTHVEGNYVVIKIRDNGTGIPDEVKEKIFNPFFTTKPAGEGTGLGLSMSYDIIVKGHNGFLNVDSEPGEFTEFQVGLPV